MLKLNLLQTQERNLGASVLSNSLSCTLPSRSTCYFTRRISTHKRAAKTLAAANTFTSRCPFVSKRGISHHLPRSLLTQPFAMCQDIIARYVESSLIILLISSPHSPVCHHSLSTQPHKPFLVWTRLKSFLLPPFILLSSFLLWAFLLPSHRFPFTEQYCYYALLVLFLFLEGRY